MELSFANKLLPVAKGLATYVVPTNWYLRRAGRGGSTNDAGYCYCVWLRHLRTLEKFGWNPVQKKICELGPGNSIGVGIAALLSGAESYTGLDAVPYSTAEQKEQLTKIISDLTGLFQKRAPIPDLEQYPQIVPQLEDYSFPSRILAEVDSLARLTAAKTTLIEGLDAPNCNPRLKYLAPYQNIDLSGYSGSFDAIFSQAVFEHIVNPAQTYHLIFDLLKPGGLSWHVIDFRSHGLSADWNGHWTYPEWLWSLVVGHRQFFLNRMPLSRHLALATQAGFEVEGVMTYAEGEHQTLAKKSRLNPTQFAKPFDLMSKEDASTVSGMIVLKKAAAQGETRTSLCGLN
jgi:SAM-dependent methyltransferase